MSWENALGLLVVIPVILYLAYALLFPERLG